MRVVHLLRARPRCMSVRHGSPGADQARVAVSSQPAIADTSMGYSFQRYLVASDDTIFRIASIARDRMLRNPERFRLAALAHQRVRSAEVVIEPLGHAAVAVVRTSYNVLASMLTAGWISAGFAPSSEARIETVLGLCSEAPVAMQTFLRRTCGSSAKVAFGPLEITDAGYRRCRAWPSTLPASACA